MTHLRTRAVHAGQPSDPCTGAITTPITQSTAFNYGTLAQGAALFAGTAEGYRYSRFGNPTVAALEAKVADLEGAPAAHAAGVGRGADQPWSCAARLGRGGGAGTRALHHHGG